MEGQLVSIITPSFNSEKFISDTIQSVQNQTYQNWEMIIVDDGSTDETVSIIQKFLHDNRIQLHQLDKNSGTGIARNTAISLAKGRYIAFLDSDDLWKPEKLQKQVEFMTSKNQPFTFPITNVSMKKESPWVKLSRLPKYLPIDSYFGVIGWEI